MQNQLTHSQKSNLNERGTGVYSLVESNLGKLDGKRIDLIIKIKINEFQLRYLLEENIQNLPIVDFEQLLKDILHKDLRETKHKIKQAQITASS